MKPKNNTLLSLGLIALAFAGLSANSAQAASQTWTNSASDSLWNTTSTNWTGAVWTNNNDAVFGATGVGSVAVASDVIVNDITFSTTGYTLTGNLMLADDQASSFTLNADETISAIIANNTAGASSLTKAGVSTLTLSGANTYTGGTTINLGTLSVANVTNNSNLGASTSAVSLDGGTLSVANTSAVNGTFGTRTLTVGASGGTLVGAGTTTGTAQAGRMIFNTANTLLGSGALAINAAGGVLNGFNGGQGAVVVTAAQTYSGAITLSSGGVLALETGGSLGSGATISIGNNAELSIGNVNVTNNVTVTGGTASQMSWANNGLGDLQGTLTLNASLVVGNRNWFNGNAQNGKISGMISGTGTLTTNGGGTLTLTGANTYNNGTTINAGTVSAGNNAALGTGTVTFGGGTLASSTNVTLANNLSTASATGAITSSGGTMVVNGNITGVNGLTLNPTNKITLAGTNNFATNASGSFLALVVNAGAGGVDITGSTTLGTGGSGNNNGGFAMVGTSTVTLQSGGSLTINGSTTPPNSIIGQNAAVTSTVLVNGGTLTVGANTGFILGNGNNNNIAANGVLTISSGTATINRGSVGTTTNGADTRLIMMGRDSNSATGTINLNGGTLATDRQFVRDGSSTGQAGTANFVFGGGTLKALGAQTDWLQSTTATSAGQGGGTVNGNAQALSSVTTTAVSTIDANSFSVAINSAISGAGGFNINSSTGTGTVTFGGTNTYTGDTTVSAGSLAVNGTSIADANKLVIDGTGKVDVTGTEVVGTLFFGGVQQADGLWGSTSSSAPPAHQDDSRFTGTGVVSVGSGYSTWATTNVGGQTPDEDYNNDGVDNGIAYFMNNTGIITLPGIVGGAVTWTNGGNIPTSAYATQYRVQTSPDLVNWTPVESGALTTNTNGPGGSLTYTLPTGQGKFFVRLTVTPQ